MAQVRDALFFSFFWILVSGFCGGLVVVCSLGCFGWGFCFHCCTRG